MLLYMEYFTASTFQVLWLRNVIHYIFTPYWVFFFFNALKCSFLSCLLLTLLSQLQSATYTSFKYIWNTATYPLWFLFFAFYFLLFFVAFLSAGSLEMLSKHLLNE